MEGGIPVKSSTEIIVARKAPEYWLFGTFCLEGIALDDLRAPRTKLDPRLLHGRVRWALQVM